MYFFASRRTGGVLRDVRLDFGVCGLEDVLRLLDRRGIELAFSLVLGTKFLADLLQRLALEGEGLALEDGGRSPLGQLDHAGRDGRLGVLKRDVADQLPLDLRTGPLPGPEVDLRVVELVERHVQGVSLGDVGGHRIVAQSLVDVFPRLCDPFLFLRQLLLIAAVADLLRLVDVLIPAPCHLGVDRAGGGRLLAERAESLGEDPHALCDVPLDGRSAAAPAGPAPRAIAHRIDVLGPGRHALGRTHQDEHGG
jgi:hypothetical protein